MTQMLNTLINFPGRIRFEGRRLMGLRVSERYKQGRLLSKTSTIARRVHMLEPSTIRGLKGDYLRVQFELVMNAPEGKFGHKFGHQGNMPDRMSRLR
jgi:hypothetical protein